MQPVDLLWPVFAQVALTFALLIKTGRSRVAAIRSGEVAMKDVALGENNWPQKPTQFARSYMSQFELPTLFYVLIAFVLITGRADFVIMLLAWAFVATRVWHSAVHTTSNFVPKRFKAFLAGFYVLAAMWGYFLVTLIAQRIGG